MRAGTCKQGCYKRKCKRRRPHARGDVTFTQDDPDLDDLFADTSKMVGTVPKYFGSATAKLS